MRITISALLMAGVALIAAMPATSAHGADTAPALWSTSPDGGGY